METGPEVCFGPAAGWGIRSNRGEQVNPAARVALRFQRKPKSVIYPNAGPS